MSDDTAAKVDAEPSATTGPPAGKSVTLSVTLHPNGQIDFQLPAGNKILAYGLVEVARAQLDKIFLLQEVKASPAAQNGMRGLLKRMNGG